MYTKLLSGKLKESDHTDDQVVDGKMKFNLIIMIIIYSIGTKSSLRETVLQVLARYPSVRKVIKVHFLAEISIRLSKRLICVCTCLFIYLLLIWGIWIAQSI
jgi:hypothetical protein